MEPTNPQVPPQQPVTSPPPPVKKSKSLLLGLGAVVLLLLGGLGGYFMANSSKQVPKIAEKKIAPSPTLTQAISQTQPADEKELLPEGWTYYESKECGVNFPLPPKEAPYYIPAPTGKMPDLTKDEGGYWQYGSNTSAGMFTTYAYINYSNPDWGGSDYIAGLIQVGCAKNTNQYTTQTLLKAYSDQYKSGLYGGPEGALKFDEVGKKTMWGHEVIEYKISGGMRDNDLNYLFATDTYIYTISPLVMSNSDQIKATAEQIFNGLKF